jgi:cell division protein FtsN
MTLKNTAILILALAFCFTSLFAYARTSDERSSVEKIEEMILKGDFRTAESKCNKFLSEHRKGRLTERVEELKRIAENKLNGTNTGKTYSSIPSYKKSSEQGAFYSVQVGAFSHYANAKKMVNALKKKGMDAVVIEPEENIGMVYKVRVGKFRDQSNAQKMMRDLKNGGFDAKIVNE